MYAEKINNARIKTKLLYNELQKVKLSTQDSTFFDAASSSIPFLKGHFIKLRNYSTLKGHFDKVVDLRWTADSSGIISLSQDGFMIIWDPVTGFKKHAIPLQNQYSLTCAICPNNRYVASAGLDNACTIYQLHQDNTSNIKAILKGHSAYISDTMFHNNGNYTITGSGDMTCILWDCNRAFKVREFVNHVGDVLCLGANEKFNPNCFASGSADGTIKFWDARQQREAQSFHVSKLDVNTLKMFPGGNSFVAGSDDGVVRLFDLRADCLMAEYSLRDQLESSMYQQPNSPYSENVTNGALQARLNSRGSMNLAESYNRAQANLYTPGVNSVDFSALGRLVFSCYANYGCIIWDVIKGEPVGSLSNHSSKVSKVVTSGDGIGVATALWDSKIKVWTA